MNKVDLYSVAPLFVGGQLTVSVKCKQNKYNDCFPLIYDIKYYILGYCNVLILQLFDRNV